jgi:hypothetical protein
VAVHRVQTLCSNPAMNSFYSSDFGRSTMAVGESSRSQQFKML